MPLNLTGGTVDKSKRKGSRVLAFRLPAPSTRTTHLEMATIKTNPLECRSSFMLYAFLSPSTCVNKKAQSFSSQKIWSTAPQVSRAFHRTLIPRLWRVYNDLTLKIPDAVIQAHSEHIQYLARLQRFSKDDPAHHTPHNFVDLRRPSRRLDRASPRPFILAPLRVELLSHVWPLTARAVDARSIATTGKSVSGLLELPHRWSDRKDRLQQPVAEETYAE